MKSTRKGLSLIAMLVIVVLVGGIASAFMLMSQNEARVGESTRFHLKSVYLAEAAIEDVAHLIRWGFANNKLLPPQIPPAGPLVLDGVSLTYSYRDDQGGPYDPPGTTIPRFRLDGSVTLDKKGYTSAGKTIVYRALLYQYFQGVQTFGKLQTDRYLFQITAELKDKQTKQLGRIVRSVEVSLTPILQWLAFYNGDLEMLPGPKAVWHGRVHSNRDVYVGAGTGLDLQTDYVKSTGKFYRHRLDNPAGSATAPVTVWDPTSTAVAWPMNLESDGKYGSNPADWVDPLTGHLAKWGGVVQDFTDKVEPMATPAVGSIEPPSAYDPAGGHFYQKAASSGLLLTTDTAGNTTATFNGTAVPSSFYGAGIIGTSTIYDARQQADVPVTTVDINQLASFEGGRFFPKDQVVYAYRQNNPTQLANGSFPPAPAVPEGVLLKNGKNFATGGNATIVSNGPVYVQGDFNAPDPGTGYIKQGVAVIADTVNLLSNAWNNTKTAANAGGSGPRASPTTYNFAMIAGNVPTNTGVNYSGGLENLPRFHEDWSGGVTMTYRGSLINLWKSKIETATWGKGGVYSPPNRNWDFDQDFTTPGKPKPPDFPMAVKVSRTTYQEGYNY